MECNYLSLSKDKDGKLGLMQVEINQILFALYDGIDNRIIVHTIEGTFYTMGTLKFFTESLNATGYHFRICDRNSTVNVDRIVYLEPNSKMAFFEWPTTSKSKRCAISGENFRKLIKELPGTHTSLAFG
ncbi:LytTR family transcriptional regulator DNA-binding domain-containing protein [Paenibacillus sp. R14(2021)]|uniref:LytTR family transcriptional regulator DNA-binding domain-containing protein n=1 Tax=Paenibacillus sp. R14(2021) TaxID=2859228 RepID=UPI001C614248|nr:LytTR family transcriptional regulator DNA-binding domain-containing protein [Paenibacillus sp. R14(2021)]